MMKMILILMVALGIIPKGLVKRLEDSEIWGDHPYHIIVKTGWNTEKSPGYLKRPAVTKTPVKDHQLIVPRKNT